MTASLIQYIPAEDHRAETRRVIEISRGDERSHP
jgi:hypothetical protein